MTVYYDAVLPQIEPVFDGYANIVGQAPTRAGAEPVFQVMSETDVRTPVRPPDSDRFRRWEVAGAAHSGWAGQEYRRPLLTRDLGAAPEYTCDPASVQPRAAATRARRRVRAPVPLGDDGHPAAHRAPAAVQRRRDEGT